MGKIKKVKSPKVPTDSNAIPRDEKKTPKIVSSRIETYDSIVKSKTPIKNISIKETPKLKKTITKKEKLKRKSKAFQSKIDLIKQQDKKPLIKAKKQSPPKKAPQNTKPVNNLKALKDALPSLDDLFQFKSNPINLKTGVDEYDAPSVPKTKSQLKKEKHRKKQREMLERMKRFNDLLKDPDYKKDARQTIANHIKFSRDLSDS